MKQYNFFTKLDKKKESITTIGAPTRYQAALFFAKQKKLFIDMKIVVTVVESSKGTKHCINVIDGKDVVHSSTATTIKERDTIIWNLADLYDTVEINIQTPKQQAKAFKYSEIPSIPVLDEDEAVDFFEDKTEWVFDRIVQAVTEGLFTKTPEVRLFELNGTSTYLTAERSGWKDGLSTALTHYIAVEHYEKCPNVKQLLDKL
mgnify:CR=1 FL=1